MERTVPRMALLGLLAVLGLSSAPAAPAAGPANGGDRATGASTLPTTAPSLGGDPRSSGDIVAPDMDPRPLARNHEAKGSVNPPGAAGYGNSWVRTTVALAGVVALIVLLGWGYRLMASRGGRLHWSLGGKHPALIQVVGRAALSPRQSLCLVRVGPRLILLGVTPEAVRSLDVIQDADLTAQLLGQAAQQRADSSTAEFARCLEREARSYEPRGAQLDETLTPEAERIIAIRERLTETITRLRGAAGGA